MNKKNFIKKDFTKIVSFNSFKWFSNSCKNVAVLLPPRVVYILSKHPPQSEVNIWFKILLRFHQV